MNYQPKQPKRNRPNTATKLEGLAKRLKAKLKRKARLIGNK